MPKIHTFRRRVGIVGATRSGKTVFLTSLINHLKYYDPLLLEGFPVGRRGERHRVRKFRALPLSPGEHAFEYERHRDTIVHQGRWPAKTRDTSVYRCSFERTDWAFTDVELEFLDFPGERVADAAIAELSSHADWSARMLELFQLQDYREAAAPFLKLLDSGQSAEAEILKSYKELLATLANRGMATVSPSTFLLDTSGNAAPRSEPSDLAKTRTCGLPNAEFAPLTRAAAGAHPALAAVFQQRYARYRDEVVLPLYRSLRGCHRLAVLLDIPTMLVGGIESYNETRKTLDLLFDFLDPKFNALSGLARGLLGLAPSKLLWWYPAGVTRVAFVATKADMIYEEDRGALKALLHDLTRGIEDKLDRIRFDYFACCAAQATTQSPGDGTLAGFTLFDAEGRPQPPEGSMKKFAVSRLPASWPTEWKQGDYHFTDVYPVIPRKIDAPPRQFGLDSILSFLVDQKYAE